MEPKDSGYASPRAAQDTDTSIILAEIFPGSREAYTRKKTNL